MCLMEGIWGQQGHTAFIRRQVIARLVSWMGPGCILKGHLRVRKAGFRK